MEILPFYHSNPLSLGVELELQIINPDNYDLIPRAKNLIRHVSGSPFSEQIKPEITQSMIEINSSVHTNVTDLENELKSLRNFLAICSKDLSILFSGGGTHPFQKWDYRKIYPAKRFRSLSNQYGYLAKQFTVFGMHVHIGCHNSDDAIYLTHALNRYLPHFISLSASSPFYQGVNTKFQCARLNSISPFPLNGHIPFVKTWAEFSSYYDEMQTLNIISSMKDFYWDIKPRPEFGSVEIRVCDTPLTIEKSAILTAFIQTLSHYLLQERPIKLTENLYHVYRINRFQACRHGYEGYFIDPALGDKIKLYDDLINLFNTLKPYADKLGNSDYFKKLQPLIESKQNDATYLLKKFRHYKDLRSLVKEQCRLFLTDKTSNLAARPIVM